MARRGGRGTDRGAGERGTSRRGRGEDDSSDTGSWSLGEYEWQGDQTGPPWEQEGWDDPPTSPPGRASGGGRAGLDVGLSGGRGASLAPGHPSGPLPQVRGRRARPAEDYPTGGFPAGDYRTGGFPAGSYGDGGYQDAGPDARDPSYRYQEHAGYEGEEEDDYDADDAYDGDAYDGDDAYDGEAEDDWYEDAEDQQDWADDGDEDDEDEGAFLPGLTSIYATRAGEPGRGGGRSRAGRSAASSGRSKRKRARSRLAVTIALSVLVVILGVGGGGFYYLWTNYLHPADYSGAGSGTVEVHIKNGDTANTIGQILLQDGVVASVRAFHNAAASNPKGNALEPGYYRLHKHMQASLALAMLLSPSSRVVYKVTLPEGLRLTDMITRLGKATYNVAGYQAAAKQVSQLGLPAYAGGKPEGYLFPDTYNVWPSTPPIQVLQEMVRQFKQEAQSLNLPKWAAHDGMTQQQVVVMASLIQAEGNSTDFAKISRVIYNRLNQQMPLGLDSTVMYALNTYGIAATPQQLAAAKKSSYDTYNHYGLPPGPIDSPGYAALYAALHPAAGNWLYFVTVNPKTGLTKFTSDFNQFSTWEAQFRAKYGQG